MIHYACKFIFSPTAIKHLILPAGHFFLSWYKTLQGTVEGEIFDVAKHIRPDMKPGY